MKKKLALHGTPAGGVDYDRLKALFSLTDNPREADAVLASRSADDFGALAGKTVLVLREPPVTSYRLYERLYTFHSAFLFDPEDGEPNQFPLTDAPAVFPYHPRVSRDRHRSDTRLETRRVFYAGVRNPSEAGLDKKRIPGTMNLYPARLQLVEYLYRHYEEASIFGRGWHTTARRSSDWRSEKQDLIEQCRCDFVLSMENCMYRNYISEKIHDGFVSDRVTLYLGEPHIEEHIPEGCYVDLRPYLDRETGLFRDPAEVADILRSMTQIEYDAIIHKAREWRKNLEVDYQRRKQSLTAAIAERLRMP
jgi:hypothetical protein